MGSAPGSLQVRLLLYSSFFSLECNSQEKTLEELLLFHLEKVFCETRQFRSRTRCGCFPFTSEAESIWGQPIKTELPVVTQISPHP